MKSIKFTAIFILLAASFSQCSKDDPSAKSRKISILTSDVWITESVTNSADGDITFQYTDFAIAFVKDGEAGFDGEYYLTGGGIAFPELTGKWKFNKNLNQLILQNGREMDIVVSSNALELSFHIEPSGGRIRGLSGDFIFKLKKIG